MKVLGAELLEIRLPLKEPFTTRSGSRHERRILLVRAVAEAGVEGWGECVAGETPSYTYETTDTAWDLLVTHALPALPGREILGPEDILAPIGWIEGHPMAKASVEMAVWDLTAKDQGVPLWELLGGTREAVRVGAVVGIERDLGALTAEVASLLERGYLRIKLKVEPGWALEPVRAMSGAFPAATFAVDANGSFAEDDPTLVELDRMGLGMIEQPLPPSNLLGHARLQKRLETPICLDESIGSRDEAETALALGACRIVNVKPGRLGGLGPARDVHDLCRAAGVPAWCGGMLESGIGRAHALALASLPGFTLPADLSESRRYWERDVVVPGFVLREGRISLPDGDGIGARPDLERIRSLTVRRAVFGRGA